MDAFKTLLGAASAKAAPLASQFADKAADFGKQASAYAHDKALGGRRRSAAAVSPLASAAVLSQPSQPEGTFAPGTPLRINNTGVTVDRFLAEGGFAHVYLVTADSGQRAVLKRTLCPDETVLSMMKSEIEFMKVLTGHANIVSFYDSEIIRRGDGHEVFILMEYCSGGPLVEYMNTRIDVRLTESEILEIFRDVLQAVYHLHYNTQQSPILHRDLKIENVLIGSDGKFKVCDFGSATTRTIRKGVALSTSEIRKLEDEVERVTTLQYRAPEFCDFYVRMGVSEKVDVWALGVLLYKLCYYETPFENVGKLAILNARYEIPNQPEFSFEVTQLISSILVVDPSQRPNVHQVYSAVCKLLGTPCELPGPTLDSNSEEPVSYKHQQQPQHQQPSHQTLNQSQQYTPVAASIQPMRRGRPGKGGSTTTSQNDLTGSSGGIQNDPWATVDSSSASAAIKPPAPVVPPSKRGGGGGFGGGSARVSTAVIDAAFSVGSSRPSVGAGSSSFRAPKQHQISGDNLLSDDDYGNAGEDDDDDDEGGSSGLMGGSRSGTDKYAAYLKRAQNGGDSDDDLENDASVVVGARKGFEKKGGNYSMFQGAGLFGKRGSGSGSGSVNVGTDDFVKDSSGGSGAGDVGFASLDDDENATPAAVSGSPGSGAFWANEDDFKRAEQEQQQQPIRPPSIISIGKKKPPPPPVPAKLSASAIPAGLRPSSTSGNANASAAGSFWTSADNSTNEKPVSEGRGAFWATEDVFKTQTVVASTQADGWATEASFENAFSEQNLGSSTDPVSVNSGWANEEAFAAQSLSSSTFRNAAETSADENREKPSPSSSSGGGLLARNAFLMADKQKQQQQQQSNESSNRAVSPLKKGAPPPPPPSRRSIDGVRPVVVGSSEAVSATVVPPPKPARRKPLPETPTN